MKMELQSQIAQAKKDVEDSFNTVTPFGRVYSAGDFGRGGGFRTGIQQRCELFRHPCLKQIVPGRNVRKSENGACSSLTFGICLPPCLWRTVGGGRF